MPGHTATLGRIRGGGKVFGQTFGGRFWGPGGAHMPVGLKEGSGY